MKKFTALLLAVLLAFSACAGLSEDTAGQELTQNEENTQINDPVLTEEDENTAITPEEGEKPAENGDTQTTEGEPEVRQTEDDESRTEPEVTQTEDDESRTEPEVTQAEDGESKTEPVITETEDDESKTDPDITITEPDVTVTEPDVTVTEPDVTVTEPDVTVTETEETITECRYLSESGTVLMEGALQEIYTLLAARERQENEPLYRLSLCVEEVVKVENVPRGSVELFTFEPDGTEIEDADKKTVLLSETDPAVKVTEPEGSAEELITLYVQVALLPEPPKTEISYTAVHYEAGAWSTEPPVFTLSGISEEQIYREYCAVLYGEGMQLLRGNTYTAEEGVCTLRFAILDEMGDVASATELIDLKCDFTPPVIEYVTNETGVSYQMAVVASDSVSGVSEISFDGGQSFSAYPETGALYTASQKTTLPAGSVIVRDNAGHETVWDKEVTLKKVSIGGGGGGGKTHAPETDPVSTAPYDGVNVVTDDKTMHVLTLDGEELEAELWRGEDEAFFTACRRGFPVYVTVTETGETATAVLKDGDTLVLTAVTDDDTASEYGWHVGGAALRQLRKSGVDYLVLATGDCFIAMSTEGFLGGEGYMTLKMQGVPTRRFVYDFIVRRTETDRELPAYAAEILLSVNGGEPFLLTSSEKEEIYRTDVFAGDRTLLLRPFGAEAPGDEEPAALITILEEERTDGEE